MLVYRVFPHDPAARPNQSGHSTYLHKPQGRGRIDNPSHYDMWYFALSPEAAVGEVFGDLPRWSEDMFVMPPALRRVLGVYEVADDLTRLDLDDARSLLDRGLRPTQVIARNRPATQADQTHQRTRRAMTTLKERLKEDAITYIKAGERLKLTTVRNVLGEISTREKAGKTPVELDDAQVTGLLQKEAAKRRDTARIYTEAGESERAAAEIAEAEVIEAYLPAALTAADVEAIVDGVIAGLQADGQELGMRQMGLVMKQVTAKVAGRFDGKAVSEIVRGRLA